MNLDQAPQYPLTVEGWLLRPTKIVDEDQLAFALENHNTDSDSSIRIWDALGRPVRLIVELLDVQVLEVYSQPPPYYTDSRWRESARRRHGLSCIGVLLLTVGICLLLSFLRH
jgi:hypothetical protein